MNKALIVTLLPLFLSLVWSSCKNDYTAAIQQLESRYATSPTQALADSLSNLYREAVKSQPENKIENLTYLTRAAELKFTAAEDAVSACRWLDDAIQNHSDGQVMTAPIGLYARIWASYLYKKQPAVRLDPDDIDKMRFHLEKNLPWIDSSLINLERQMGKPGSPDKTIAMQYIETCEAYADLVQKKQPEKSVDLLMKAAGLAKTIENPNKALQLYNHIVDNMPGSAKAPTAMFMTGFIYENDLGDVEKARGVYEGFLKKYPNDPDFTDDAQMALKLLGKSPEEIIKSFEKAPQ